MLFCDIDLRLRGVEQRGTGFKVVDVVVLIASAVLTITTKILALKNTWVVQHISFQFFERVDDQILLKKVSFNVTVGFGAKTRRAHLKPKVKTI
jgi:hypothetical protein